MTPIAKIKICGITNLHDALFAARLGADFLGFNFYSPSPRFIVPDATVQIIAQLPNSVISVGLFVNESVQRVIDVARQCGLNTVQLHGKETATQCRDLQNAGLQVIKAFHIERPADIAGLDDYQPDLFLLDAYHPALYGGTGQTFDWSWIPENRRRQMLLAGGITPNNVAQALAAGTLGIDLCSGVEDQPGVKDHRKLMQLFHNMRRFYELNT